MSYLDNGVIRLGVDLGKGGTITYLSTSNVIPGLGRVNVINSHDLGREVQQSYRSGPDDLGGPNDGWNANGAGDGYGHPSPVLEQANDTNTIYTKTMPLLWGNLNDVSCECITEQWITLDGSSVHVHNRLTNNRSDHTEYYDPHGQELPAAYTNGTFWRLITYNGSVPYTNAALTELPPHLPGPDWSSFLATEHWAALVNDSGFGLGVFNPGVTQFLGGFAGDMVDVGGPGDDPTGYIAPVASEIIDWNIVYEYDYALVLGTVDEIRAYAVAHRPDDRPDYQFARDRQHFPTFVNSTDNGWPISGALRVNLNQTDPYIVGPEQWWQASEMPYLYITAAYHTSGTEAQISWRGPGADGPLQGTVDFQAIPDGQYHTYAINLTGSPTYRGTITRVRFDPTQGNDPGGYVDIASITWKSPDVIGAENYQGLWWAAPANSEAGWGINFAHQQDTIFASWFTYDLQGKGTWLVMSATKTGPNKYEGQLLESHGPPFNAEPFPATATNVAVGSGTLTFGDGNNGSFRYDITSLHGAAIAPIHQSKKITRLVFGTVPTCRYGTEANLTAATNYQDMWWAKPAASESGWGINLNHEGDTIFATWFTYDLTGAPLWLVSVTSKDSPGVYEGRLLLTSGPTLNASPWPDSFAMVDVGSAMFSFTDGNNATFDYTVQLPGMPTPVTQQKPITRQLFSPLGTTCQ